MGRRSYFGQKVLFFAVLLFLGQRACSPPDIGSDKDLPLLTVEDIYRDMPNKINKPVILSGKVLSSFFVGSLGGGYFLQGPDENKTIICLTKQFPPPDGALIQVAGVVKPFLYKGNFKLLYFKTKAVKMDATVALTDL